MNIGRRLRARSAARGHGPRDDRIRARGRGDDDVGLAQVRRDLVEADREALELGRELARALDAAVGDDHAPQSVGVQVARGERDRLAGADQERGAVVEAREHRPGHAHGGSTPPTRRSRRSRVSVRTRLATEKAAWNRRFSIGPGRAGFLGRAVGVLELPEDLRLAEHQRVESRRDREDMRDGAHVLVPVQAVVDARPELVVALQPVAELRLARLGRAVDLGAVAGGDDQRLADRRAGSPARAAPRACAPARIPRARVPRRARCGD